MTLIYRAHAPIDDLKIGECAVRPTVNGDRRFWQLWFCVLRENDGEQDLFAVPIHPGGGPTDGGPGGKTWGFTKSTPGVWQVAPSIHFRLPKGPSLWHQTPRVVGVPDGEPWMSETRAT